MNNDFIKSKIQKIGVNNTAKKVQESNSKKGPVVLVSRDIQFTFPLSYAYLAGYLKEQGEEVVVLFKTPDYMGLIQQIMALNPVLVGFGNLYPELLEVAGIIDLLNKAGREFPVVIGGQMVSPTPEFAVAITGADYGVTGEGEISLYKLVSAIRNNQDPSGIGGLVVRRGDDIVNNGPGEYFEDLTVLPKIPYELFPTEKWLPIGEWYAKNCPQPHWKIEDRVINVHGGRGCPFKCNFCYHHSKPRYRPISKMIEEGKENLERFNGNMLYFSDDLVLANPKRARELVEELKTLDRPIEYSVSARFDSLHKIDDPLLREMKLAGCRIMGLGIESGSDRMLKKIGKNVTSDVILEELYRLKENDILPTVSIMVGQDGETREDVEASIELMRKSVRNNPDIQYAFTIATPFPGSKLYDLIFQRGIMKDDLEFFKTYFSVQGGDFKLVANLSNMSNDEIFEYHQKLNDVYKEEKANAQKRKLVGGVDIDEESKNITQEEIKPSDDSTSQIEDSNIKLQRILTLLKTGKSEEAIKELKVLSGYRYFLFQQ